jgi:hypothetical protein
MDRSSSCESVDGMRRLWFQAFSGLQFLPAMRQSTAVVLHGMRLSM